MGSARSGCSAAGPGQAVGPGCRSLPGWTPSGCCRATSATEGRSDPRSRGEARRSGCCRDAVVSQPTVGRAGPASSLHRRQGLPRPLHGGCLGDPHEYEQKSSKRPPSRADVAKVYVAARPRPATIHPASRRRALRTPPTLDLRRRPPFIPPVAPDSVQPRGVTVFTRLRLPAVYRVYGRDYLASSNLKVEQLYALAHAPHRSAFDEHRQGHPVPSVRRRSGCPRLRNPWHGASQRRRPAVGTRQVRAHHVGARLRLAILQGETAAIGVALDYDGAVARIGEQPRHRLVESRDGAIRQGDPSLTVGVEQRVPPRPRRVAACSGRRAIARGTRPARAGQGYGSRGRRRNR